MSHWFSYPNRLVCSVLSEMRDSIKCMKQTRHTKHLMMLVEEAQTYVNRMESALEDWSDIRGASKEISKLKDDIKYLEERKQELDAE